MTALLLLPLQLPAAALDEYLEHIAAALPDKTAAALQKIEGTPRQLLAARAYLRAGDNLQTRWSWSADEIQAHA